MKRRLLASCLAAYLIFLIGSFVTALYLTPVLIRNYLPAVTEAGQLPEFSGSHFIAIQNVCYLLLCAVFLLSLIPAAFFWLRFYRPLGKITAAAEEYARSNPPEPRQAYIGDDELGRLAASVNYLAGAVHSSGESQRRFISNISHDFRSPLTSIKGYVEAILDGTIPPEMQEKYLNIVLDETERLNKLTEGLLTLNTFDDRGGYLEITDFDIAAVLRSVVDSFEGTCQKKNLRITASYPPGSTIVSADMGKIQQVLYNLIDNAIKFSYPDSEIEIAVSVRKNTVFVSVKDHGEGIARENLPKIWERFYKTDSSRGRDKKGTGLGLSIVKEIIRAHGQNINVISTEGAGTEFFFSLARGKS